MTSRRKHVRLLLAAIVAVALVVRFAAIYQYGPSVIQFGDAPDYLSAAAKVCATGAYPDGSSMPFFRAPGLPFFIAAATGCHTNLVWLVKAMLALADALSVAMVFLLSEELFPNHMSSLTAAGAAAIYPFFVAQVCDVESEGLFMLFFLGAVWFTLRAVRAQGRFLWIVAGACAGAAALVRPAGLLLLPFLAGTALSLTPRRTEGGRRVGWFAVGVVLCLCPWVFRNELRYGEFILVNDAGGYNFWRGTSPEMAAVERLRDPREFAAASLQFETVTSMEIARGIESAAGTPLSRSREWYKRAMANFAGNPGEFVLHLARNALAYWRPWLSPQTHSRVVVVASGLMVTALYVFAVAGWNLLRRRDRLLAAWCAVGMVWFWIPQIPFQVVNRFRIPVADPFLIILAAASITAVVCGFNATEARRRRRAREAPGNSLGRGPSRSATPN